VQVVELAVVELVPVLPMVLALLQAGMDLLILVAVVVRALPATVAEQIT